MKKEIGLEHITYVISKEELAQFETKPQNHGMFINSYPANDGGRIKKFQKNRLSLYLLNLFEKRAKEVGVEITID